MRKLFAGTLALFALAGGLFTLAPAASAIEIHAHRGGPNVEGVATYPENSLSGMTHSLSRGWVIEFDLKPTSDDVAVVMHDDNLDRTTNCSGPVDEITSAALGACRIDLLGSGAAATPLVPGDPRLEPVPELAQVIDLLQETGGRANIEVKDLAGEHPGFASDVYAQLQASGLPSSRVIVQNFRSADLAPAKPLYPGVATSLLSPIVIADYPLPVAIEQGIDWLSPRWPVTAEFAGQVWAAGKRIVPYTIDDAAELEAAGALRVDAVISNDPTLADRLVGDLPGGPVPVGPDPPPGPGPDPVTPKPSLSMLLGGKLKVRAGRKVRVNVKIRNFGDGASGRAVLRIRPGRSGLAGAAGNAIPVPAIAAGAVRKFGVSLKAKPRRKKFGRFPVRFVLVQDGLPAIKVTRRIRVTRR